jgi:hypothetical protein
LISSAVDDDGGFFGDNRTLEGSEGGIVLEEMRQRLGIGEVIDRHELEVLILQTGFESQATDTTKTINTNSN